MASPVADLPAALVDPPLTDQLVHSVLIETLQAAKEPPIYQNLLDQLPQSVPDKLDDHAAHCVIPSWSTPADQLKSNVCAKLPESAVVPEAHSSVADLFDEHTLLDSVQPIQTAAISSVHVSSIKNVLVQRARELACSTVNRNTPLSTKLLPITRLPTVTRQPSLMYDIDRALRMKFLVNSKCEIGVISRGQPDEPDPKSEYRL